MVEMYVLDNLIHDMWELGSPIGYFSYNYKTSAQQIRVPKAAMRSGFLISALF